MKNKFPDILVAVDANRRRGIRHLLSLPEKDKPEVILLDDAYQHRYVRPSLSIVLSDCHRLFYKDRLLPAGLLREPASNIKRADIVVVTKCDEGMKPVDLHIIEEKMKLQTHQLLFFTGIVYGEVQPVFPSEARSLRHKNIGKEDDVLLIAGIASPAPFIREAEKYSNKVLPMVFPDHHTFSRSDFKRLEAAFEKMTSPDKWILVTEKDAARLKGNPLVQERWKKYLYYLPIVVRFDKGQRFDETIEKHIITFLKK